MRPQHTRQRFSGSTVPPNRLPVRAAYDGNGPTWTVGPGGGNWWGGGPRRFVGSSRGPDTRIELGRPGDFVEGGDGTPQPGDLGFPHASRWPGWPNSWEPPYFDTGPARTMGGGYGPAAFMGGGPLLVGRVSTVFSCTDLISRTLATMGLKVLVNGTPVPPPEWTENPEAEVYTSIVEAMQGLVNSLLHRGNAYVAPTARESDGTVARWVVLNPDMVEVEPGADGLPVYRVNGMNIPRTELLHMRYQTWPGSPLGVGPLEACSRNLIGADAMQSWGTELAVTNGIPTAVLSSEAKLTRPQADEVKQSWAEAAMSRGTLPAVLSGGLTYTPLNLRPADVGLLDLRMFDEQRIASCFGVPLWLVGLPMADGLTYSTVDGTFDYFWRVTLRPLAYNIGAALSGWALPRGAMLRFSSEQITEPNVQDRANVYKTMIDAGVITPAEARFMEHLPPVPPVDVTSIGNVRSEGV